ncbi:MAG: tetratricopeptide repeat protein, partial [Nitrospirae bacterium]
YNEAVKDFDKTIEINPQYATAFYNRGLAYALSGYTEKSIDDFQKACDLNLKVACKKLKSLVGDRQPKPTMPKQVE